MFMKTACFRILIHLFSWEKDGSVIPILLVTSLFSVTINWCFQLPFQHNVVDYADLLRSKSTKDEKRHQLESIYEELRSLAYDFACPIWTASQTNRGGLDAEVITMSSISEAFSKCFVADFIFTVSRTIEDKNANTGRVFIAKNRNGPDGLIFPIFMDPSRGKIKVLNQTSETIGDIVEKSSKERLENLKQK